MRSLSATPGHRTTCLSRSWLERSGGTCGSVWGCSGSAQGAVQLARVWTVLLCERRDEIMSSHSPSPLSSSSFLLLGPATQRGLLWMLRKDVDSQTLNLGHDGHGHRGPRAWRGVAWGWTGVGWAPRPGPGPGGEARGGAGASSELPGGYCA